MLLCCSQCHNNFIGHKRAEHHLVLCSRCLSLQEGAVHRPSRLGLHPALERRLSNRMVEAYAQNQFLPSVHPSLTRADNKSLSMSVIKHGDSNFMPRIPGFEIAYQIGKGAMGSVFRAREVKTGQLVAIKVLSHELSIRSDLVARFERESYALKSLKNPNIVSIIGSGQVDETHYFAMEYIDGITLRTRMSRGPIGIKEAAFITQEILNGLKTAHKAGIIHRDLKPENVLLEYGERDFSCTPKRVVLVDFGLVGIGGLAFDPHPNLTRSKVTMGTVNYMAPEQHVDAKRVDHRSDLYSAGVILFEMITGELPLGRYLMPGERGMDISEKMESILARALARAPEDRYATAILFHSDLADLALTNNFSREPVHQKADLSLKEQFLASSKTLLLKHRYVVLVVVSGVFFGLGIKFSLSSNNVDEKTALEIKK
jgi:serine/threonine protein kinase